MSSERLPKKIEKNIGMLSNVHIIVDFGGKHLEQQLKTNEPFSGLPNEPVSGLHKLPV